MKTYARIVNNRAVDVTTSDPTTLFHPDVASQFVKVPNGTMNNATLSGDVWTNPVVVTPEPVDPVLPTISAMQFYLSFTIAEILAIKGSSDPIVKEFYARYEIAERTDTPIDPNLVSVKNGLTYLSMTNQVPATDPPSPYLHSDRIPKILLGIPQ